MTEWTYWRRFYRKFNWDAAYKNRCEGMRRWLQMETTIGVKPPPVMVANNARMILDAYYRGRWWTVWGVFKDAFWTHYAERYAPTWEWIRTRIFRRPPDPDLQDAERFCEELDAVDDLAKQL